MHNDTKLYLIFEFLDLDLKKYMDSTAPFGLSAHLVKVQKKKKKKVIYELTNIFVRVIDTN